MSLAKPVDAKHMTAICDPDRALPARAVPMTSSCMHCGAPMIRRWDLAGTDFSWSDEQFSRSGGNSPIPGIETIHDWLDWLQEHDVATYSSAKAAYDLGGRLAPWEHWHEPAPTPQWIAAQDVPQCCGMPMQSIRDGWRCRERRTIFVDKTEIST
ncbi:MAG: hypothetical protein WA988_16855 [Candidatus Nanopelagicales bacterium]